MADSEYAKAIQTKATVANLEINAALTTEQQAQIGQDFIAKATSHGTARMTVVSIT